ncbi:MAG: hypothetical protein ACTSU4_06535 [Promethearchaeota archaeon]
MNLEILKKILFPEQRKILFEQILTDFQRACQLPWLRFEVHETPEGKILFIRFSSNKGEQKSNSLKIFIGAQHNEYNGLFGILEFLRIINRNENLLQEFLNKNQEVFFFPLMNPHGFLNPTITNKSGYYLKDGTNLNRYWYRTFMGDLRRNITNDSLFDVPPQAKLLKKKMVPFWKEEEVSIFIVDFHETSLLRRFPLDLKNTLTPHQIIDHWLKKELIENIMTLNQIPLTNEEVFRVESLDKEQNWVLNLKIEEAELIKKGFKEFLKLNEHKLPFYFYCSRKSKKFCQRVAFNVYQKMKDKLWTIINPVIGHYFHEHGCFIHLNENAQRKNFYVFELESDKHFFDLFDEIKKVHSNPNYLNEKRVYLNYSIELVANVIQEILKI